MGSSGFYYLSRSLVLILCSVELFRLIDCLSPLFIFGDSLFDAGNNNYIKTVPGVQANFPPYGETFFHYPTGRFSDGRLIPDFIAEYAGLPPISPYLQPGNNQFIYGSNFASAGAGVLVEIYKGLVIDLKTQVKYLMEVQRRLRKKMGDAEAKTFLSNAVFLISIGSNDYLSRFFNSTSISIPYTKKDYVGMVIGNLTNAIEDIYNKGGRKFAFLSLPPLGCIPSMLILQPEGTSSCVEGVTEMVKLHNKALFKLLPQLHKQLKGFKYTIYDFYDSVSEILIHPAKYGFKYVKEACCGSGPYRGIPSCGGKIIEEYQLCKKVSEYFSFDSGHPTEKANQLFAENIWTGTEKVIAPYNLKTLFEQ